MFLVTFIKGWSKSELYNESVSDWYGVTTDIESSYIDKESVSQTDMESPPSSFALQTCLNWD